MQAAIFNKAGQRQRLHSESQDFRNFRVSVTVNLQLFFCSGQLINGGPNVGDWRLALPAHQCLCLLFQTCIEQPRSRCTKFAQASSLRQPSLLKIVSREYDSSRSDRNQTTEGLLNCVYQLGCTMTIVMCIL